MTHASVYRRFNQAAGLRSALSLLLGALMMLSFAASAEAHGLPVPAPYAATATGSASPADGVAAIVTVTLVSAQPGIGGHCPSGASGADHNACAGVSCAGVSCHAVAGGTAAAADFESCQTGYERFAATGGDGRIIAPLFHPPKI